ncbi:aspartyl protease family protein At5g10770-like [Camellia sinensis]|uniref:aspartyl protease family protein At5g10770-like n=1 Tax=Camellia sinensis TaxID=4442 RepID=UPI001036B322|nr:aspartyl protease family protein At5g10770-like [Camellia sinensis]
MAPFNLLSVNNHLLSFVFFLFSLCYLKEAHAYGARGVDKPYHEVPVKSLEPNPNCTQSTTSSTLGSKKLQVTYRYGPCSPIGHGRKVPNSTEVFSQDKIRADSINRKTSNLYHNQDSKLMVPVDSTGFSMYVVTVGFGTPKRDYTLIFDTGSDTTWMQCQPCPEPNCYKQDEQMFDPSQSTSYHNGSCKSSHSNAYDQVYRDGTHSKGFLGCDTLTLDSDVITNFEFGCGQENSKGFGAAAGMLGLGRGELSLISQTASKFGQSFSYCLPTPQNPNSGYLLFGKHAKSSSFPLKFTPLLQNPADNLSLYFVELVDITVGTKRLNVSPLLFSSPGTVVDSGTAITQLPQPVYLALRSAFRESMSKHKYPLAPPPVKMLDTCYDLSQYQKVTYPNIFFHFGGGTDVSLDQSGIMSIHKSSFCLAFAAKEKTSDYTIIGSTQQQALNVFYDLKGGKIGFGTKGCHN